LSEKLNCELSQALFVASMARELEHSNQLGINLALQTTATGCRLPWFADF